MNLVSVKNASDIKLAGVSIEFERNDNALTAVRISDPDGNFIIIKNVNAYSNSVAVMVKEPPKTEERFLLKGEFAGIKINQAFEHRHEADQAMRKFDGDGDFEIIPIQVQVDDEGNGVKAFDANSSIPF